MRNILWLLVIVGLFASLYSASRRWHTETRNRSVEITLDYAQVREVATAQGTTIEDALQKFQAAGVTSIAVGEDTIGSLDESHRVNVTSEGKLAGATLSFTSPQDADRVLHALDAKNKIATERFRTAGGEVLRIAEPYSTIRGVGIGLDPAVVRLVRSSRLAVVGRIANFNGIRPDSLRWTLTELQREGVQTIIFSGEEMLGYKGYLLRDPKEAGQDSTESVMRELKMNLGMVEFGKQKGDAALNKALEDRVVRVHTITGTEMVNADIDSTIQRFLLGARERNIRLLYVRLFLDEADPLKANVAFIEKIVLGLTRGNLEDGLSHPYAALTTPAPVRGLIGLGVAAAWLLLVDSVTGFLRGFAGRARGWAGGLGWGGAVILLLLPLVPALIGVKLAAFAAACIYPSLALLYTDLLAPAHGRNPLGMGMKRFALACIITGCGIAAMVGLLSDRIFLIKADAFVGIKPAQVLPLLLVSAVYVFNLRATSEQSFSDRLGAAVRRVTDWAREPIRWWQVGAALLVLIVVALLLLRSGNDPGIGVSPIELKFRALLDRLLYARPRFKEFLLGHPILILALIWGAQGRRKWALPLLCLGVIGQVSFLNTFCHLHTPLLVGLWRALLGLGIGVIIGVAFYLLLQRLLRPAPVAVQSNRVAS